MSSGSVVMAAPASGRRSISIPWQWGGTGLAFLLSFTVYLRTLAPTVYGLDSAELTNAAYVLGLVHPPGYPLYLLVGHLFTRLPWGEVGYRLNLMSAFFGALAVALLFRLLLKLIHRPLPSLAASLLLAYSFFFWSAAVMAEVYTLHITLLAALILSVLTWQERRTAKWLYLVALLYGLSLANHLSTLLLAPGLLYWLLAPQDRPALRPRQILLLPGCLALGLSLYLYLPLRYAARPPALGIISTPVTSWGEALAVISARPFWGLIFAYSWPEALAQGRDYLYALWGNFLSVGLVIGLVGAGVAFRRRRNLFIGLALIYLANALFFIGYRTADKGLMFLPAYFIWAIWLGLGYDWLLGQINALTAADRVVNRWRTTAQGLFLLLALAALAINFPYADLSHDRRAYERANRIFESLAPEAYVLAVDWFEVAPLEYLQLVEGRRPDVRVLNTSRMSQAELRRLIEIESEARPFYSTASPAWLRNHYRLDYIAGCNCYRLKMREP